MGSPLFQSFFLGGFECSCQRLRSGRRLNLTAATAHDRFARQDYLRLQSFGIRTVRDGISWPQIEIRPGHYDFSSALPLVRAAHETGTQVIWDLCHYGWPDDLDIFSPHFVTRFARFAGAFARLVAGESGATPFYAPVNEISFFTWAGGDVAYLNPFMNGRGDELKVQLVSTAIAAIRAIWEVEPRARIVHPDPVINVAPDPEMPGEWLQAGRATQGQWEAWDMIAGKFCPEIGGAPKYLDIIGINYYGRNQWIHKKTPLEPRHPLHRPLRDIIAEVHARYRRPLFIAETGAEGAMRPGWLRYIAREVRGAMRAGVPVQGLTLYPILDYPGWDDDRHCPTGLIGYPDDAGGRELCEPLAREVCRQIELFEEFGQVGAPTEDIRGARAVRTRGRWRHLGFSSS